VDADQKNFLPLLNMANQSGIQKWKIKESLS
jgi:hypothetical protein